MLECVCAISRRGLGSQLSSSCWSSILLVQATISFLMVDCCPDWRRSFRPYPFVHAKMRHRVCDVFVSPREASRPPFFAELEQNGGVETRLDVVRKPNQLSYDARGRCCYKWTIISRAYFLSWRRMIDQKEPETRSNIWHLHTSNTGITCYQHCTIRWVYIIWVGYPTRAVCISKIILQILSLFSSKSTFLTILLAINVKFHPFTSTPEFG